MKDADQIHFKHVNSSSLFDESEAAARHEPLTLDAVLVYEDMNTGLRARQVLESVASGLPGEADVNAALWRFDLFWESAVRETALNEAMRAGIVLVSAHGKRELPAAVQTWLKQWLERKSDEPCALVVSLDASAQAASPVGQTIASLQTAAEPKGVVVFPHFGEPLRYHGNLTLEALQRHAHTKTATLDEIQQSPGAHSHWGINE